MSTAQAERLAKAQERLALCQARITRANDQGRRHTVKMVGDLAAAKRAVEEIEQEAQA